MNVLSLCSGIGGLDLAMKAVGGKTVCYVEIEEYRQEILLRRMQEGWLDCAPIWPDLRDFDGRPWRGVVDCIVSGFPCTPFSVAGERRGELDERNLWPDVARAIAECQPTMVFLENSPNIGHYAFHQILPQLQAMGYEIAKATITSAAEMGAGHIRRRLFIFAHSNNRQLWQQSGPGGQGKDSVLTGALAGHTSSLRRDTCRPKATIQKGQHQIGVPSDSDRGRELHQAGGQPDIWRWLGNTDLWATEPSVARVVYGLPNRVDRASALGDAIVWQQAELAWKLLRGDVK